MRLNYWENAKNKFLVHVRIKLRRVNKIRLWQKIEGKH